MARGDSTNTVTNGENGLRQHESTPYRVIEQYHSQKSHIKIIQVGAGFAGLAFAYKLQKTESNYELTVYEKDAGVGGTWFENRYPGIACDVPAHIYTFSFEPNPEYDSFYSGGEQIRRYLERFAEKYALNKYIKLNSRVTKAAWDQDKGIYDVEINTPTGPVKDWCHLLANGTGFLNSWKWPDIPGLKDFKGELAHSAHWDETIKFTGKNVGVIGTGSSAIQIVPQAQRVAKHLTSFMRSETWISPPIGGQVYENLKTEDVKMEGTTDMAQFAYSEAQKKAFSENPEILLAHRKQLETNINGIFQLFLRDSEVQKNMEKFMREEMLRRIGPGHDELKEKFIPKWAVGCRRLTPGDGYLEALVQPNVTTVFDEIDRIAPEGLIDRKGRLHELDVLVCATGFKMAFAPPFQLLGRDGVNMQDDWNPDPRCYLGLAAPKFPNYFVINGPRGNWANGSIIPNLEVQAEYIIKFARRMQEEGIKSIEVSERATADLNEHMDVWHQRSSWSDKCRSWYKNNIPDGKVWLWSGSGIHYMKTIKEPRYEHFGFEYHNKNIWAFLGDGTIEPEAKQEMDKLAPYIRNSDTPWEF